MTPRVTLAVGVASAVTVIVVGFANAPVTLADTQSQSQSQPADAPDYGRGEPGVNLPTVPQTPEPLPGSDIGPCGELCAGHPVVGDDTDWIAIAASLAASNPPAAKANGSKASKSTTSATADTSKPTTAICNDGTTSTASTRSGACARHSGVKQWQATAPSAQPSATSKRHTKSTGAV